MDKGINTIAKNLSHHMKNIEIVANNLANINSTGFKRELPFSEYLSRAEAKDIKQITDYTEGMFTLTGNPLDLALSGEGFFMVKTERGLEITKNGKFSLTDDGFLINAMGNKVMSAKGEINISAKAFDKNKALIITKLGEIKLGDDVVDRLMIAKVENPEKLMRTESQNFYLEGEEYDMADEEKYNIIQGYLEESNTNPILEMQAMIGINKDYETSQKIMNSMDRVMGMANEVGKV
ncbi:MAG: flagellar hook-basal body complex protein [Bacteroidetes bacterium]|nr:flagellar hook-basal body complex protein [Bacteroidota bacterium]